MENKKIDDFKKPIKLIQIDELRKNKLLREVVEDSLKLPPPRDLNIENDIIYKDINNLLSKHKFNLIESFIVLSSFATSLCEIYIKRIEVSQIKEEKKQLVLGLLNDANDEVNKKLPVVTQRLLLADGLYGERYYCSDYIKQMNKNIGKRFKILKKYNFTCQYCGRKAPNVELQIDHIMPKSLGGSDTEDNLTCSCWECNLGKSNKLLDA